MPTYNFHNTKTDKKWTEYMSISEMEEFIQKKHISAPTPHLKALLVQKDSKIPWNIQFPTVNCLGRL